MSSILIIDDDVTAARTLSQALEATGHTCSVLTSGESALQAVHANKYDLVALDVMLPGGVSGFEICRQIRRDPKLYTLPILIISAMNSEEEVMHGLSQGADDYVPKPLELSKLIQRIEALLRATAEQNSVDTVTDLPGPDSTKREVQKRIVKGSAFALAYAELLRIREFSYMIKGDARNRAIRHFGRTLSECGKQLKDPDFFVGHMGGGHFVCVLPPAKAEKFCERAGALWREHLEAFYTSIGHAASYHDSNANPGHRTVVPMLDTLFSLMYHESKEPATHQRLFENLSHVRMMAQDAGRAGVFIDRRA